MNPSTTTEQVRTSSRRVQRAVQLALMMSTNDDLKDAFARNRAGEMGRLR